MLTLAEYLKDPCGNASLPYWKQKTLFLPDDVKIVHDRDYRAEEWKNFDDEPYFRLLHNLKNIAPRAALGMVDGAHGAVDEFVRLINACYSDLRVTLEQIEGFRKMLAFCPDLWVLLKEGETGRVVGGGIGDFDGETGEATLEWIQVLPECRGRGYGHFIVNELLERMRGRARFATVSGKVKNPTRPEKLYRNCGFTGSDVWHILVRKRAH